MADPNISEIATTTLESRTGELADNVTRNNALLRQLEKRGNLRYVDGGRVIRQEIEWDNNLSYRRYSGYDALNISPSTTFSSAEFNYAQAAVAVSMSGLEMIQNAGEEELIELLTARIENAERTMRNMISLDVYSDGTADGGKQLGGLQAIVPIDPTTGTVGGINRATAQNTFWRNQRYRAVTDGGAAMTSANITTYMNRLWYTTVRGNDAPKLIIADNTAFRLYEESLQAIQRIGSPDQADAGFQTLLYKGVPVMLDGGYQGSASLPSGYSTGGAPSSTMYFLNLDYLFFRPHRKRHFVPLDPDRFATNQDAMVKLIGFAGQLTGSNFFLQGILNNS